MPVNNTENLENTIESILNQSITDIEIICINNTKDNTILEKYQDNDDRIIVQEKNQHLMLSLNNAIQDSKGNYILIADQENLFNQNVLTSLYSKTIEKKAQLAIFKQNNEVTDENIKIDSLSRLVGLDSFTIEKIKDELFEINANLFNKLFNKEFLLKNNIKFDTTIENSEELFFYESLLKSEKTILVNEPLYKTNNKRIIQDTIGNYEEYIKCQKKIMELFNDNYSSQAYNNLIKKTVNKYDTISIDNKKRAYEILRKTFIEILDENKTKETLPLLTDENRKSFEQIIISESVEEYELLKEVNEDKKTVNKMNRYEKLLKIEQNKIKNFNNSLLSSNSWKLTKIFRIR